MDTESNGHAGPSPVLRRGKRIERRRARRRRSVLIIALVIGTVVSVTIVIAGSPSDTGSSSKHPTLSSTPATRQRITTTTTIPPTTTTTTDPGLLPQTAAFPSTETLQFQNEMTALWQGIVIGSVQPALPAFFPESAYVQLKTLSNPQGDYENRLLFDYAADINAAHALLGSDAPNATLTEILVPSQFGHWIPPGVCDNRIGYFEVANSRVVYQENGQTRSFGIASMISWRGVWYVVHLGAILRSSNQGVVEDPQIGPGTSANSNTC